MISLTDEEKKTISSYYSGKIKKDGKIYFFKVGDSPYLSFSHGASAGLELVMERACKAIDLHCAHYEIVKIGDYYHYLSEDINTYGKFKKLFDLYLELRNNFVLVEDLKKLKKIKKEDKDVLDIYEVPFEIENSDGNMSMYNIWTLLEKKYGKEHIEELMKDLIKTYVLDILFYNSDRHGNNIGVLETNDKPILYVFDNSLCFNDSINSVLSSNFMKYNDTNNYSEDNLIRNRMDLINFLETSSDEYKELCMNIINKLSPEYVERIMIDVKNEYNLDKFRDDYFKIKYKENYEALYDMIYKRGLK